MKTIIKQTMALAAVLTATSVLNARADQPAPTAGPEKTYTGQVVSVDPQDRMLNVKSWMFSNKEFNLGANCTYVLLGVNNGTVGDIRPGQKITVHYVDSQGVRIADLINQHPMQYEGMVTAIDSNRHTLTLHRNGMDQPIQIADGCNVTLRDNKPGALADVQPGDHVTVTYETPNGTRTARQISQTSIAFTGKLTAIDLEEKTVKAKGSMETMKFNLANNCAIVINGRTDGKLSQLMPDERLSFNYDSINGVNVVNRIAPAPEEPRNSSFSSTTPGYQSYPTGF
jgi:predicted RNA-binding protein